MKFCSLYSGSSGNSLFVSQGNTKLLIDAGLSGRCIEQALYAIDEIPSTLTGIVVTHEHRDHIHGVGVLSRRYNLPIYANEATWIAMEKPLGKINEANKKLFTTQQSFGIGDFQIKAFHTSHDAAESVGFIIENGISSIGIVTDTGLLNEETLSEIERTNLVVLESNHDVAMLESGPYPFPLKQRIKGDCGHLSNESAAQVACRLAGNGVSCLILAHLSEENNYPLLAYQTTVNKLSAFGIKVDIDVKLSVAKRKAIGEVHQLK